MQLATIGFSYLGHWQYMAHKMLAMLIKISIFVNKISNAAVYRLTNQTAEFVSLAFEFPIFDKVAVIAVVGQQSAGFAR